MFRSLFDPMKRQAVSVPFRFPAALCASTLVSSCPQNLQENDSKALWFGWYSLVICRYTYFCQWFQRCGFCLVGFEGGLKAPKTTHLWSLGFFWGFLEVLSVANLVHLRICLIHLPSPIWKSPQLSVWEFKSRPWNWKLFHLKIQPTIY